MDRTEWCSELISVGDIVQDGDDSVTPEEAERRFDRYVELLNGVTRNEPDQVFRCILASVRHQDDYGARQAVMGALLRFGPSRYGRLLALSMAALVERVPSFAGELLCDLANQGGTNLREFNSTAGGLDPHDREMMVKFVASEEVDGWLGGPRQGKVRIG